MPSNNRRVCKWGSHLVLSPTELILVAVSVKIPTSIHKMCNPNHWIADTGASMHSTAYPDFVHNCQPVNIGDSITVAQGATVLPD